MTAAFLALFLSCIPAVPPSDLPGPVTRPFVAPACQRCSGHRGITVAAPAGANVRALVPGTVTFDGQVANRRFVVMRAAPGVLVTYGDLSGPRLVTGTDLGRGAVLGVSAGSVYVGVRRNGAPVDPRFVVGAATARLLPPAGLACPVGPAETRR